MIEDALSYITDRMDQIHQQLAAINAGDIPVESNEQYYELGRLEGELGVLVKLHYLLVSQLMHTPGD